MRLIASLGFFVRQLPSRMKASYRDPNVFFGGVFRCACGGLARVCFKPIFEMAASRPRRLRVDDLGKHFALQAGALG